VPSLRLTWERMISGPLEERGVHREAVVLGGDLDAARAEVLHGMVGAAMAELELEGLPSACKAEDLVAEADAEDRKLVDQLARGLHGIRERLGVAGAVREEDALGLQGEAIRRRGVGGHDGDVAAQGGEHPQDVLLHAEVVGDDTVGRALTDLRGAEAIGLATGHLARQVQPHHRARGARPSDQGFAVLGQGGDDAALGSMRTQMPGERARVQLADPHDALLVEISVQLAGGAPRGGDRGDLAHHEAGHLGLGRLHVVAVHPVVADVGIGHRDDLPRVRGIGEHLLVAAQGGVEDHLARGLRRPAEGAAGEQRAVLQGQDRAGGAAHRRTT
jgi:hypothetical protein